MSGPEAALVAAAENVLQRTPTGSAALVQLEWAPQPTWLDPSWFDSTLSLFRAQGRVLATTPALGLMMAHAVTGDLGADDYTSCAAVSAHRAPERVELLCSAGAWQSRQIIVDLPGEPLAAVAVSDLCPVGPRPGAFDPDCAIRGHCLDSALRPIQPRPSGEAARARWLARVATASEMLGASERLLESAVQYAKDRRQFGQPIGTFQAVQHELAEASVQLTSLIDALSHAERVGAESETAQRDHYATMVKALAGRVAKRVTQASLQIFGGMGFTWEHHLHRYQRRLLTLDALYGSSDELVNQLGADALGRRLERAPVL